MNEPVVDVDWHPPKSSTAAWVMYDLANTIFALGVGALYFASWITERDVPDIALSITVSAAMIVVIVAGPLLGARSDHRGHRMPYLMRFTVLAVIPTFFLATVGVLPSLVLFALALIAVNLGSVMYDALLPDVSTEANRGYVSGLGVGVGYLGSFIALGVGIVALDRWGYPTVFRAIAVLFLVFSIPAFVLVRERPRAKRSGPEPRLRDSVQRLVASWRLASQYEGVTRFLIGRFLYTDAINTLIAGFLTIFVIEELSFTDSEVELLLGLAIVTAIAGGLLGGVVVDRLGARRTLHLAIELWIIAMILGIVAATYDLRGLAWGLGAAGGFALGATWSADRVYMARISPPRHLGEFYGLYATVGRFATVLGPLVGGVTVDLFDLPRTAALGALVAFLVVGRIVLSGVHDHPRRWEPADLA